MKKIIDWFGETVQEQSLENKYLNYHYICRNNKLRLWVNYL